MSRAGVGERKFSGRYYLLAGRGTKDRMRVEAAALRRQRYLCRIVRANPFAPKAIDDWAVYAFPKEPRR